MEFINFFLSEFDSWSLKTLYILSKFLLYWHEFVNDIDLLPFDMFEIYNYVTSLIFFIFLSLFIYFLLKIFLMFIYF